MQGGVAMEPRQSRWINLGWLFFVGLLSSLWCWTAAEQIGPTFDEPGYIREGLKSWHTGSNKQFMSWGTMPLPIDVQTLPLYLWERYRGATFDPISELPRLLPMARHMNLIFWWVLLAYGYRWGKLLGGPWAGRITIAFLGSDPNLLGHAALATTDIALTAMIFVASYHWWTNRASHLTGRVLLPGLLYGVALCSKASALPYVPIIYLTLGLYHLGMTNMLRRDSLWSSTAQLRWDLVATVGIGLLVCFAYCGTDWQIEKSFVQWANSFPGGPFQSTLIFLANHTPIFPNAGEGLIQQIKHNFKGHGAYLLGEWHDRAVWYYFPVALSIKLTEPTLVLAAVLLFRPRHWLHPITLVCAVLLAFSLISRVQIGIRLVFPLLAFLHLMLAIVVVRAGQRFTILAGLCAACSCFLSWQSWPHGISHVNQFRGSSCEGYRQVADSNYDWGQGLPELKSWWEAENHPRLAVWYYGTDPAILLPPFRHLPIHALSELTPASVMAAANDEYLAVSVTALHGGPDRRPEMQSLIDWFQQQTPVARTTTFLIYRFEPTCQVSDSR
jgi:hypothetical protein